MTHTPTRPHDRGALSGFLTGLSFIGGVGGAMALADAPLPRPGAKPRQIRRYFTQNARSTRVSATGQAISAALLPGSQRRWQSSPGGWGRGRGHSRWPRSAAAEWPRRPWRRRRRTGRHSPGHRDGRKTAPPLWPEGPSSPAVVHGLDSGCSLAHSDWPVCVPAGCLCRCPLPQWHRPPRASCHRFTSLPSRPAG